MPLVEIVGAAATGLATMERATAIVTAWGKVPVRCADTPGFIVNRINRPFTLEALAILESGLGSVSGIDAAVRTAGYPMGPFELMDLIGLDVNLAAAFGVFEGMRARGDRLADRFRPSLIQEQLVAAGRLGRKTGGGFYAYDADGPTLGEARDIGVVGRVIEPLPAAAVTDRITLAIVNEAYRAFGEGVASAADIDLAMRLGAGHPIGPFVRTAAMGGPAAVVAALERLAPGGSRFMPAPALREGAASP
jgi:3-hydroxybutyryl-CoA dehydrogenase